ncbi:hypothetical protein M9Y10_013894 [Tritrichomonas musculus]|uniref:HNH nuclease domain-containing protein n=1 Tax=Tritrichomonas musculus TaxID=1915356 RepID=A0ABR2KY89_9EUKA
MSDNQIAEFVPLKDFEDDYEIQTEYPFVIRRIRDKMILTENSHKVHRYITVCLNQTPYFKHVLIAKQFIPNPNNLPEVDHINHDRTDYHLSNLRWVTSSQNNINKSSNKGVQYEFIDDIPEDASIVDFYNTYNIHHAFEENRYLYYHDEENDEDLFYGKTSDNAYKILHVNTARGGKKYVSLQDINNKRVSIYIDKYRYQHDL